MHKLRIVGTKNGATRGTEVWLDDMRLQGVTRVHFGAELNDVCKADISINVCKVEIESRSRLLIQAVNYSIHGVTRRIRKACHEFWRRSL